MKKGRCVICGALGQLTRDHVPPRSVSPLNAIEITSILPHEAKDRKPNWRRRGFQAPMFPSLCVECNGNRLGHRYDPCLAQFISNFAIWARALFKHNLSVPEHAVVGLRPASVARAVVGHLLAAEERADPFRMPESGSVTEDMRSFFLGLSRDAESFRIVVWPYGGSQITIMRNFSTLKVVGPTRGPITGDLLKFFPFAFWVVYNDPAGAALPYANLSLNDDSDTSLKISLRDIPRSKWPELPHDGEMILHSSDRGHLATPRRARRT